MKKKKEMVRHPQGGVVICEEEFREDGTTWIRVLSSLPLLRFPAGKEGLNNWRAAAPGGKRQTGRQGKSQPDYRKKRKKMVSLRLPVRGLPKRRTGAPQSLSHSSSSAKPELVRFPTFGPFFPASPFLCHSLFPRNLTIGRSHFFLI